MLVVDEAAELWRRETLMVSGYPAEAAARLAPHGEIDLHLACKMVAEQGCSVELALQILL
jgi:hypothetical protein